MIWKIWKKSKSNSEKKGKLWKKSKLKSEKDMGNMEEKYVDFPPYFTYFFTFQPIFLPNLPYHFTIQTTFLPYFPYFFTFQHGRKVG
jgi:hypothetical protein